MKRLALFRFHNRFDVCASRLKLLRQHNPGVPIHGLFGGREEHRQAASKLDLDDLYCVPMDDPYWKWTSGDLCTRWWFRDCGIKADFEILHLVEWDMVLVGSLDHFFGHIRDGVGLTLSIQGRHRLETWMWTGPGGALSN